MSHPRYILCKWESRMWPAKILPKDGGSRKKSVLQTPTDFLDVEILCLQKQIRVKCANTFPLEKSKVENIATELDQPNSCLPPVEEITYRKALRIALEILSENFKRPRLSSAGDGGPTSAKRNSSARLSPSSVVTGSRQHLSSAGDGGPTSAKRNSSARLSPSSVVNGSRWHLSSAADGETASAKRVSTTRLSPSSAVNGSEAVSHKKAVKKGLNLDVRNKPRRSPRLSSCCKKATASSKDQNVTRSESNERSRESLGPIRGGPSRTSKSRTPALKAMQEKVAASARTSPSPPSLADGENVKPLRKSLRNSPEQSCVPSPATQSTGLTNAPVSSFRHSLPLTPMRKVSPASVRRLQKSGAFCVSDTLSEKTDLHTWECHRVLVEAQRSSSLDPGGCDLRTPLVDCKQGVERGRCQSCPNPILSPNALTKFSVSSSRVPLYAASHALCKATRFQLPDFEVDEREVMSSDLSVDFSSLEDLSLNSSWVDGGTEDDDEELPSILLQQEPCSIESGMLVWCKYYKYPYWPGVVNYVRRKMKKASVLFVEESLADPTKKSKKGVSVALRGLKHFDCEEKQDLTEKARQEYGRAIDWCIALISDYRIRLACGSFSGSFTEYCAAEISYPVRKEVQQGPFRMTFPTLETDTEDSQLELTPTRSQLVKKCLPDRTRASRDKANEKLVEYIVKARRADQHLLSILKGQKKSRWLHEFLHPSHYLSCVETYLEDDEQLEMVVAYLQDICVQMTSTVETLMNGDTIRFILEVLLPEAVIYAISAVDKIDYKKAEEKYMRGPSVSKREREMFEEQILEKKLHNAEAAAGGH